MQRERGEGATGRGGRSLAKALDEGRALPLVMGDGHAADAGAGAGLAALRCPVHADDPLNPENRAGTQLVIDTLAAPDTGPIARAKTAIALHLASDGRAAPLASYRPSTAGARARGEEAPAGQRSITALFALERAPEPEPAEEHATGEEGAKPATATMTPRNDDDRPQDKT